MPRKPAKNKEPANKSHEGLREVTAPVTKQIFSACFQKIPFEMEIIEVSSNMFLENWWKREKNNHQNWDTNSFNGDMLFNSWTGLAADRIILHPNCLTSKQM